METGYLLTAVFNAEAFLALTSLYEEMVASTFDFLYEQVPSFPVYL